MLHQQLFMRLPGRQTSLPRRRAVAPPRCRAATSRGHCAAAQPCRRAFALPRLRAADLQARRRAATVAEPPISWACRAGALRCRAAALQRCSAAAARKLLRAGVAILNSQNQFVARCHRALPLPLPRWKPVSGGELWVSNFVWAHLVLRQWLIA